MKSIWIYPQVILNFYSSRLAGGQKPGFCDRISLQSAETAKNPVSRDRHELKMTQLR